MCAADAFSSKDNPRELLGGVQTFGIAFVMPCIKMGWYSKSLTVTGSKKSVKDRVLHLGLYLVKV